MSLLSVIFALLAESFISRLADLKRFDVFFRYASWLREKLPTFSFQNGTVSLIIVLGSVSFVVWLLSSMLGNVFGLFEFVFGIAVLIYTLGPRDLDEDAQQVISALEAGEYDVAKRHAESMLGEEVSASPMQLSQTVKESILIQANSRLLAVFFWFIFLGPVGAVLFRLTCLLKHQQRNEDDEFAEASRDLYRILIWLPARICVLSYAVAGSFVDTMSYWKGLSDLWLRDSEDFIIASGIGALRFEQHETKESAEDEAPDIHGIQNALSLVKRATIVWVVLLGLLTVTGWLF